MLHHNVVALQSPGCGSTAPEGRGAAPWGIDDSAPGTPTGLNKMRCPRRITARFVPGLQWGPCVGVNVDFTTPWRPSKTERVHVSSPQRGGTPKPRVRLHGPRGPWSRTLGHRRFGAGNPNGVEQNAVSLASRPDSSPGCNGGRACGDVTLCHRVVVNPSDAVVSPRGPSHDVATIRNGSCMCLHHTVAAIAKPNGRMSSPQRGGTPKPRVRLHGPRGPWSRTLGHRRFGVGNPNGVEQNAVSLASRPDSSPGCNGGRACGDVHVMPPRGRKTHPDARRVTPRASGAFRTTWQPSETDRACVFTTPWRPSKTERGVSSPRRGGHRKPNVCACLHHNVVALQSPGCGSTAPEGRGAVPWGIDDSASGTPTGLNKMRCPSHHGPIRPRVAMGAVRVVTCTLCHRVVVKPIRMHVVSPRGHRVFSARRGNHPKRIVHVSSPHRGGHRKPNVCACLHHNVVALQSPGCGSTAPEGRGAVPWGIDDSASATGNGVEQNTVSARDTIGSPCIGIHGYAWHPTVRCASRRARHDGTPRQGV